MKERRAGCFAFGGGSKACPDLFEGSFLELLVPFVSRQKTLAIPAAMSGKNKFPFIKQSSFTLFRMTSVQRFKKINYNQNQMSSRYLPFSR